MIGKLIPEQCSAAQKNQKIIDDAIADKGRETVSRLLGLSKAHTDLFSELLAGLGVSVCPANTIPVEKSLVQWAWLTCRQVIGTGELLKKARVQYELHFNESILKMSDE